MVRKSVFKIWKWRCSCHRAYAVPTLSKCCRVLVFKRGCKPIRRYKHFSGFNRDGKRIGIHCLGETGIVNYSEHELPECSWDVDGFPAGYQVTTKNEDFIFFQRSWQDGTWF